MPRGVYKRAKARKASARPPTVAVPAKPWQVLLNVHIRYRVGNDASGKYRWWTPDMEPYGQFFHANSLEEIENSIGVMFELLED